MLAGVSAIRRVLVSIRLVSEVSEMRVNSAGLLSIDWSELFRDAFRLSLAALIVRRLWSKLYITATRLATHVKDPYGTQACVRYYSMCIPIGKMAFALRVLGDPLPSAVMKLGPQHIGPRGWTTDKTSNET